MAAKLLMTERVSDSKLYYIRLNFAKFAAKEEIIIIIKLKNANYAQS